MQIHNIDIFFAVWFIYHMRKCSNTLPEVPGTIKKELREVILIFNDNNKGTVSRDGRKFLMVKQINLTFEFCWRWFIFNFDRIFIGKF